MSPLTENRDPSNGDRPPRRLTESEAAAMAEQVAGLGAARLPLPGGLRAMAEETPSQALRWSLVHMAEQLERGVSLDAALDQMGPAIPSHLSGLVRAGVRSGRLDEVMAQYVHCHSMGLQLRRKAAGSMVYPALLLIIFLSVFAFMMILIVPKFKRIFMDFGVELPDVTLLLLSLSDWSADYGQVVLGVLAVSALAGWFLCRLALDAAARRRLVYLTPLMGPLWRWTALSQFARILAMLVESELPLPLAIRLAGEGVGDAEVADAARQMAAEIESGRSLAETDTGRSRLPAGLAQCLERGGGAESLADSLRIAAEMAEGQAMTHAEYVLRAAPPLTMVVILALLAFIVTGLFMPLIKLITELSG